MTWLAAGHNIHNREIRECKFWRPDVSMPSDRGKLVLMPACIFHSARTWIDRFVYRPVYHGCIGIDANNYIQSVYSYFMWWSPVFSSGNAVSVDNSNGCLGHVRRWDFSVCALGWQLKFTCRRSIKLRLRRSHVAKPTLLTLINCALSFSHFLRFSLLFQTLSGFCFCLRKVYRSFGNASFIY